MKFLFFLTIGIVFLFGIGILSADFSIIERKTSLLSKENSPCRRYAGDIDSIGSENNENDINNDNDDGDDDSPGFVSCAKRSIWSNLAEKINCTLPGVNFTNILRAAFSNESYTSSFSALTFHEPILPNFFFRENGKNCKEIHFPIL
jgi:hypothetical protein